MANDGGGVRENLLYGPQPDAAGASGYPDALPRAGGFRRGTEA
ncbi:hypothetical protein [Streptomyces sp. NPDC059597]